LLKAMGKFPQPLCKTDDVVRGRERLSVCKQVVGGRASCES
jgi:hypothetical protein